MIADPSGILMWYNAGTALAPRWITVRGSSKLEGYHSHLHAVLGAGSNYSPELAHALITWFNFRWNIQRGIQNRGDTDFHSFRWWDLQECKVNEIKIDF